MVRVDSAQLQGVMWLFLLVGSAASMVATDSALSTTAQRPSKHEAGVANMAVTAGKCAIWKAVALLQQRMVSVPSMGHAEHASLMAALPTHDLDLNNVTNTAVEGRTSRALWRAAPPRLNSRVSAPNTAAI